MPNSISPTGLTVDSLSEIVAALTASLQTTYGSDINVGSNSPDGQAINIYAQVAADMLELLVDVYNSFSVDTAYGTLLDQRVALNGITRRQGTFTQTNILVTVTAALTLTGQDALVTNPNAVVFTVADGAGNQFQLITSHTFSGAGSATLLFQSVAIGQVQTTVNTITNIVTTVLGVSSVNNPASAVSTGVNEETDSQLRIRHAHSFALAATGPADSVSAALLAIPDVTDAYVVENATTGTVNSVPANSIWAIVTGGTDAEIAQAIYAKKGIGCGMYGAKSHTVSRPNGNGFVAVWDASVAQSLYVSMSIQPRVPGSTYDATTVKAALVAALVYKLGQSPTIGDVVSAMLTITPSSYLVNVGVSTDGLSYFQIVNPTDAKHYFTLSTAHITLT